MKDEIKLDHIDRRLLGLLIRDSKRPYAEMAALLKISTGTVHGRIEKLRKNGVLTGSKVLVDHQKLGFEAFAFIGINLREAADYPNVLDHLKTLDEVLEAYYTTGRHSIFIKVVTRNIGDLHNFLLNKLQNLSGVQSTETLISLDNPIHRDVCP